MLRDKEDKKTKKKREGETGKSVGFSLKLVSDEVKSLSKVKRGPYMF